MASPAVSLAGSCAQMVRDLGELAKNNYAFELGRQTGMLDALFSPTNGAGRQSDAAISTTQGGKKYITTKFHYKIRTKPCEILTSNIPSVCQQGTQPVEQSVTSAINQQYSTPLRSFSNSQMVNICQDTQAFIREYVMSDIRALREKIDEYALAFANAAVGRGPHQNQDVDTPPGGHKAVKVLGTSTDTGAQAPLYANFVNVLLDYQYNQLNGIPMIVGDGNIQKFWALQQYSCCNAPGVLYDNAIATSGAAFFADTAASRIMGTNNFLSIAPNVLHFLLFNENTNINIDSPTRKNLVISDPLYPAIKYDWDWEYTCDKVWTYKISLWFDLFQAIRTDSFGTDNSPQVSCEDELAGVTGIFGWTGTN